MCSLSWPFACCFLVARAARIGDAAVLEPLRHEAFALAEDSSYRRIHQPAPSAVQARLLDRLAGPAPAERVSRAPATT